MRRSPPSDHLCDAVVLAFALWTVCAHAVVAVGGGLVALLLLYAPVVSVGLTLGLRLGSEPPPLARLPEAPDSSALGSWVLRSTAVGIGLALALSFVGRPDSRLLWWSAVILLGVAAVAVCRRDQPEIEPADSGWSSEILLWILGAACVGLTLVSHRPDADDAFYVNIAVATADAPWRALLSADTLHGIEGLPLYLPVYRVDSYELLNGALAFLTGLPAIYVFHGLSAAFWALLAPLAHAKLFRLLTPRWWLWSVTVLLVVLVAAGETHRWYGNFAFVRMWQGKAVLLSVFLPLIYAYGLRFAVRPNLRDWTLLCAAQIGAVGCSSSALWAGPAAAFMALCCGACLSLQGLKTVMLGALGSLYVLGVGVFTRASLGGIFGGVREAYVLRGGEPWSSMHHALVVVLGDSWLLVFGVASTLTGWALAAPGLARRFAVVCPLAVLLGLLNPYTAGWISANVLGPSYWRSMWGLPLPILMTLALTSPLHLGGNSSARRVTGLVLLAAFAILVPRYSGLSPENGVELSWPRLKVPGPAYRWAAAVNQSVPPGSPVAVPPEIDSWIVTFHHHAYPLTVRHYLRPALAGRENVLLRWAMRQFVARPELVEAAPRQFRDGLDRFAVRAVCMASSQHAGVARTVLRQAGFHRTIAAEDYELWVRTATDLPPPAGVTRPELAPFWSGAGLR